MKSAPSLIVKGWKAIQKFFSFLVLGAINKSRSRSSSGESIDSKVTPIGWRSSAFIPISEEGNVDQFNNGRRSVGKQIHRTVAQTGHQIEEIEECATPCTIS